jgi:hypothetical protein
MTLWRCSLWSLAASAWRLPRSRIMEHRVSASDGTIIIDTAALIPRETPRDQPNRLDQAASLSPTSCKNVRTLESTHCFS